MSDACVPHGLLTPDRAPLTAPPRPHRPMLHLAHALALAFLAGPWTPDGLRARAESALGGRPPWLAAVARRVLHVFPVAPHADHAEAVVEVIRAAPSFRRAVGGPAWEARRWMTPAAVMLPRRHPWPEPELAAGGDLAAWLGVTPEALDGFADVRGLARRTTEPRLRHYRVRWVPKASGGWRALEVPKASLKALQRRVLDGVLAHVPAHPAAHGFARGRSALTHARAHAGRAVVLRLDLADFFATVHGSRVRAIFREAGYPDRVAGLLAGLCTTRMARDEWNRRPPPRGTDARWRALREPHLAQGAPTSPALANLAAFGLDRRLHALARAFGATYTRYADDLTFSGDARFRAALGRFRALVEAVARDEGFALRAAKTRVMPRARRQLVTGLVVNARPNVPRDDYDRLRATLHRCATRGPAAVEREGAVDLRAHLRGLVAHVAAAHPARGAKLLALYDRVAW